MSLTMYYLFDHLSTYHKLILKVPNKSLSKEEVGFCFFFNEPSCLSSPLFATSQGNKYKAPAARKLFHIAHRKTDQKRPWNVPRVLKKQERTTHKIFPPSSLCSAFPSKHTASQRHHTFISNCWKLISKAQLISGGCVFSGSMFHRCEIRWNRFMRFWPRYSILSFAKTLSAWILYKFA